MFSQLLIPVGGSLALSFVAAVLPVVTVLVLLGLLRRPAWQAALAGLVVGLVVAVALWKMPIGLALNSVANGAVFALWPVMWIVVNALLLYNVAVKTGRFDAFRAWIFNHLPNDRRVVLVVVGFCFGALLEGVAGFGTPVAITSSLRRASANKYLLTEDADMAGYLSEPRELWHGKAACVVRPGSTAEVAAILGFADGNGLKVVPQGGNTGLVGGQTPDTSGREILLSLVRLDKFGNRPGLQHHGGRSRRHLAKGAGSRRKRRSSVSAVAGLQGILHHRRDLASNAGGKGLTDPAVYRARRGRTGGIRHRSGRTGARRHAVAEFIPSGHVGSQIEGDLEFETQESRRASLYALAVTDPTSNSPSLTPRARPTARCARPSSDLRNCTRRRTWRAPCTNSKRPGPATRGRGIK